MRKIDRFTNQYSVSKTLKFKLIPYGKTEENFEKKLLLKSDEKRAEDYARVKKLMDAYHKKYIDTCLKGLEINEISEFAELYYKNAKTSAEKDEMDKLSASMIKHISKAFKDNEEYKKIFGKEMIENILPEFVDNEDDREAVLRFVGFTTYFSGFYKNRENIYSGDGKSTEVAYRLITQNLPKFLDNCKTIKAALAILENAEVKRMTCNTTDTLHADIREFVNPEAFNRAVTQEGIDIYNQLLGGYTTADGQKIQGINELINLYNQQNHTRLAIPKPLFKQILSDRTSVSFIPDAFSSDAEVIDALKSLIYVKNEETGKNLLDVTENIFNIISDLNRYDASGIYVKSGTDMTSIAKQAYGDWQLIQTGLENRFEAENPSKKKDSEAYAKKRESYIKHIKSLSLAEMDSLATESGKELSDGGAVNFLINQLKSLHQDEIDALKNAEELMKEGCLSGKALKKDDKTVEKIKNLLDSFMEEYHFLRRLMGNGDENGKDDIFYGQVDPLCDQLSEIVPVYNKIRNYVTQKPYSKDKIKLNFDNVQLLDGWDRNKECDYRSIILRKEGRYYLGIMDKKSNRAFENYPYEANEEYYEKMIYKLLPDPSKMLPKVFFAKKNIEYYNPSKQVLNIRDKGSYKQGDTFDIEDCHIFIDFYKKSIDKHEDWKNFDFKFSDTSSYKNIGEFFNEVKAQGYALKFDRVSSSYVDTLVEQGNLFLFQIYNKDFSEYSKGTPNLHTIYFRELFSENNIADVVLKLNGKAEMFYRKASISKDEMIVHPSNVAIVNKNPENVKKTSTFDYVLIKDRRFTNRSFMLHLPIDINYKSKNNDHINGLVRDAINSCSKNYVIGIDRGERNLIYVCVIDSDGNIVEQSSMNTIIDKSESQMHRTNYHRLLDEKEKGRKKSRQDWKTIDNISNIKEGYVSQVVHKICELVEKYDAIIAMEDLNGGFKNSRVKVEKQVYQKFEKMLIDKLNYMADKKRPLREIGGVLNAYQLTEKFESFEKMGNQNGFIFYIPAWLTSKIDPTTGFVDLLKPRYESIESSKELISTFKRIEYNAEKDWFEFEFSYDDFPRGKTSFKKEWTLISYGNRIKTFRNPAKNNEFDSIEVDITEEFKNLFKEYDIDITRNIQSQILENTEKKFFVALIKNIALLLQMRNSITGTEVDYLISSVMNEKGEIYCSNNCTQKLPCDADANGAYNIARKALWAVKQIKECESDNLYDAKISISNAEWLEYAQTFNA